MGQDPVMIGIHTSRRHGVTAVAVLVALGASLMVGCSSKKAAPAASANPPFSLQSACGHSFDAQGIAALRKITGKKQLYPALAAEERTVKQVASALRADLDDTSDQKQLDLCLLGVVGGLVSSGLEITFQWWHRNPHDKSAGSEPDQTEYDLAYGASSFDNTSYLSFTCPLPGALASTSRAFYITAEAETFGLDAVGRTEKREAAVRLLYSPALKVAAALGCQGSDLPPTLGTLKPLPMKK